MDIYSSSKSSLSALVKQTIVVLFGLIVLLIIFSGRPPVQILSSSVCLGIAWVAWSEKTRLSGESRTRNRYLKLVAQGPKVFSFIDQMQAEQCIQDILSRWHELSDQDRQWMMQTGTIQEVPSGKVLIREGKPIDALYIVLSGAFEVSARALGDETITTFSDGQVVGEMSFVKKGRMPSATVKALEISCVWALPRTALNAKISEDSDFAAHFYLSLAGTLADRLRETTHTSMTTRRNSSLQGQEAIHRKVPNFQGTCDFTAFLLSCLENSSPGTALVILHQLA
jgi:CRP/FNR family transcriptional regulator, cyclic AMP receptor protein